MKPRIFTMAFSKVYPMYIQKRKKGRLKEEVDKIIFGSPGMTRMDYRSKLIKESTLKHFCRSTPN